MAIIILPIDPNDDDDDDDGDGDDNILDWWQRDITFDTGGGRKTSWAAEMSVLMSRFPNVTFMFLSAMTIVVMMIITVIMIISILMVTFIMMMLMTN